MVLTEIERGPKIVMALATCRALAEEAEHWKGVLRRSPPETATAVTALMNLSWISRALPAELLDLGNLMVGR